MSLEDQMSWTSIHGDWQELEGVLTQSNVNGITRYANDSGYTNYIVQFKFRMTNTTPQRDGEVKFIITHANESEHDPGERWRIDLMYGPSMCRVSASSFALIANMHLVQNQVYSARIATKDNLVSVDIDGMSIIRNFNIGRRSNGHIGLGTYNAAAEFSDVIINPFVEKKCFVMMPFDASRNMLYDLVIAPVLHQYPRVVFQFIRADKSLTIGKISDEISEWVKGSDVIIADITNKNPNVFYELGLAHALKRKAILLIQ